jgi:type III pantothenate kinase
MAIDKVLAIDVGNTHTVVGLFKGDEFLNQWRITSGLNRTEDEFGALINFLISLKGISPGEISGVAISSVVPDLTFGISEMAKKYFNCRPFIVNSEIDLGMKILYKDPAQVGADRLCNSVAGVEKYGSPLVIIDFGTATTFDCINKDGEYVGGLISPGIQTTIAALHSKAAKLPVVEIKFPKNFIGNTTDESIQSGILNGAVCMLEGITVHLKKELGEETKIIATGGMANKIANQTSVIDQVDRHLSLEGIIILYNRNYGK